MYRPLFKKSKASSHIEFAKCEITEKGVTKIVALSQSPHIVIVGAGPSGLIAAIAAAQRGGTRVTILEKNSDAGRKLLLTGQGRCNVTNFSPNPDIIAHFFDTGKFLYKSLHHFDAEALRTFFASQNLRLVEQERGRAFPETQKAKDVLAALLSAAVATGVEIRYNTSVTDIKCDEFGRLKAIITADGTVTADACIIAVGGCSYPRTGSSGDGYAIAERHGHRIVPTCAGLAPIHTTVEDIFELQGVSVRDIRLTLKMAGHKSHTCEGDLLFTHFGITGPAVLRISRFLPQDETMYPDSIQLSLDSLPKYAHDILDRMWISDISKAPNASLKQTLKKYLPTAFLLAAMRRCAINPATPGREWTKAHRVNLLNTVKAYQITPIKPPLFEMAMVTAGGVDTKDIDPKTMQSKKIRGLYFAGEVIDVDGDTGGYNLQAAFSTGHLAGQSAHDYVIANSNL